MDAATAVVRLAAAGALTVGDVSGSSVSLISGGALAVASADSLLSANLLRVEAASVGTLSAPVNTAVGTATVSSAGAIYLSETDAMTIGAVSVSTQRFTGWRATLW